jgi:alkylation response protein AidB-like acyl-CoA dehydrogenase
MTDHIVNKRDIEFVLYELNNLLDLTKHEKYEGMTREDFDIITDEAIKFCKDKLAPLNQAADAEGCRIEDGQVYVPESFKQVYADFGEGGWIAMSHNPELGGMGLPVPMSIMMAEIAIGACGSFMFYPGLTVAAGHLVENFGEAELRDLIVPKLYSGEWTGTMCLTEPQAGTAVGDVATTAAPIEGTNEYSIKGNKIFISAGDHQLTDNILHLVLARLPGDPPGTKGISLFVVPKHRFDATGKIGASNDVTISGIEHKMGITASSTCSISFGDEGDCRGYLIGEARKGIVYMFQMMNEARITCGIQGLSLGGCAYRLALEYARERVQGPKMTDRRPDAPKVKIIEHPDVRRNLMISKSYTEGMRALIYRAAMFADISHTHPDADAREHANDMMELLTPIAKAWCTDIGFKVTELAIQIHGGYGYIKEYAVEQYMRDVKIASLYEGTNGIQALDLLGRKMRLKGGGVFLGWLQDINEFLQANAEHPTLAAEIAAVDKAKNAVAECAFNFTMMGKADPEAALLGATPFLEAFGYVEVGRLLVESAVIADAKLAAIFEKEGATDADAKRKVITDNPEARFYDGKVKTGQFFAANLVPKAIFLAKTIKSGDRSALDIVF